MKTLNHIDDFIAHQVGAIIIKLTWVNHDVYTVTVYNGEDRIDDLGGAFDTETEARLIARGYAQMFEAELIADINSTMDEAEAPYRTQREELAGLGADVDTSDYYRARQQARAEAARFATRGQVHRKPPTAAELHAIANHTVTADGRIVVTVQPGQSWLTLRALHRRIPGVPTYKAGTLILTALTYRPEQLAGYLTSEGSVAA